MIDDEKEMVSVYSGPAGEAEDVKRALEGKGISTATRQQTVPVTFEDGLPSQGGIATVEVLVPQEDYEKAQRVLDAR